MKAKLEICTSGPAARSGASRLTAWHGARGSRSAGDQRSHACGVDAAIGVEDDHDTGRVASQMLARSSEREPLSAMLRIAALEDARARSARKLGRSIRAIVGDDQH